MIKKFASRIAFTLMFTLIATNVYAQYGPFWGGDYMGDSFYRRLKGRYEISDSTWASSLTWSPDLVLGPLNIEFGQGSHSAPISIRRAAAGSEGQIAIRNAGETSTHGFSLSVPAPTDPKAFNINEIGGRTILKVDATTGGGIGRTYLTYPVVFGHKDDAGNARYFEDDDVSYGIRSSTMIYAPEMTAGNFYGLASTATYALLSDTATYAENTPLTPWIEYTNDRIEISTDTYIYGDMTADDYYGDISNTTGINQDIVDARYIKENSSPTWSGEHTFEKAVTANQYLDDTNNTFISVNTTDSNFPSGAGTRMMWIPNKFALRSGYVDGTQWDSSSIGTYSIALGEVTTASGVASTAMGAATTASGVASTSMGFNTVASGSYSTAMGDSSEATGYASFSAGRRSVSTGSHSVAIGYGSRSTADGAFTISDYQPFAGDFENSTVNSFAAQFSGGYKFEGGDKDFDDTKLINLADPTSVTDAVNKRYVDNGFVSTTTAEGYLTAETDPIFSTYISTSSAGIEISTDTAISGDLSVGGAFSAGGIAEIDLSAGIVRFQAKRAGDIVAVIGSGSGGTGDNGILQLFHNGTEYTRFYTTGNSWTNTGAGNFGVGTASPSEKLDVIGNVRIDGGADEGKLFILGQSVTGAGETIGSIKFASKDGSFYTTNPKTVAMINVRADQTFGGDDDSASSMQFFTSPVNGGTGESTTERMRIRYDGNVGINETAPVEILDVGGNVRADSYIEYSSIYTGDALSAVKNIKPESTSKNGDWKDIDHNTLPEGVRYEKQYIKRTYKDKKTGETITEVDESLGDISDKYDLIETTETFVGRNLGNQAQFNMRAIQQLLERVELIEAENAELRQRIEALEGVR